MEFESNMLWVITFTFMDALVLAVISAVMINSHEDFFRFGGLLVKDPPNSALVVLITLSLVSVLLRYAFFVQNQENR
jgi:NADH:ubiquinone oxidoreductase subunit 2 (subunit N)